MPFFGLILVMIAEDIPVFNEVLGLTVCIAAMIHSGCLDTGLIALLDFPICEMFLFRPPRGLSDCI